MAATVKDIVNIANSEHYKRVNGVQIPKPLDLRSARSTEEGRKRAEALLKKYHFPD